MSPTHDMIIDNSTGANVRADINNALAALVSNSSSSSEPATKYAYMWWADTSAGVLKIRNSANNAWIELLQLDGTLTLEDGSNSAPALAFRDDLDTGIFSGAANTFNISTGAVERLKLSGTECVFNETGADVDFRVESDTKTHMIFVDAGNNRVGIGCTAPDGVMVVQDTSHSNFQVWSGSASTKAFIQTVQDSDVRIGCNTSHPLTLHVGGNSQFKIDTSNRILIAGSTASSADSSADDLVLGNTGQGNNGMTIVTGNANNGAFFFADQDGTVQGGIRYQHGDDRAQFYAGGDTVLQIRNKGVGINEGFPTEDSLTIRGADTNDTPLLILRRHSDGDTTTGEVLGKIQFISNENNVDSGNPQPRVELHAVQVNNAGAAKLEFYTVGNFTTTPTKAMTLNQEGRLCVGTDDAVAKVNVHHSSSDTSATGTGTLAGLISVSNSNSTLNNFTGIVFGDRNDSQDFITGLLTLIHDHSQNYGDLLFFTNGSAGRSEKMRLLSGGTLLVGSSSTVSRGQPVVFQAGGGSNSIGVQQNTGSNVLEVVIEVGTTSGRTVMNFMNSNGSVGSIQVSGSSTSFNTSSDYRLKENEVPISDGITRLKTLKPYRFNFKADPSTILDGFFAHEVTAVPEAIQGTKDEVDESGKPVHQGLDYGRITPLLTAALQEAIAKIEVLETKVAMLEAA